MHANLHMSAISRSNGRNVVGASAYRSGTAVHYRSAVACAAYRSGERMTDERYEQTHDFSKKHNVLHAEIVTPQNAPAWMQDREKLWNGVEAGEKRKDAQLAKEALLVLPRHLTLDEQKEVVRSFIHENITSRGLVADFAIHSPAASDGERNPHAHVMFTLRPVDGDKFGQKLTGYKNGGLDGVEFLEASRKSYERLLNEASEKASSEVRFDLVKHRQSQRKTIEQLQESPNTNIPTPIWHIEKRGDISTVGALRRQAQQQIFAMNGQSSHGYYSNLHQISYYATKAIDNVRDDLAHKYYEIMYGAEHAYPESHQQHFNPWEHER